MSLTEYQRLRLENGMPYQGLQPAVVFIQIMNSTGLGTIRPEQDRFYVCDGRHHGVTDLHQLLAVSAVHAFDRVSAHMDTPRIKCTSLRALKANGDFEGNDGKAYYENYLIISGNYPLIKFIQSNFFTAAQLARAKTLSTKITPLTWGQAFESGEAQSISDITRSVAQSSRDAYSHVGPSLTQLREIGHLFRPAPSF